jgi:hypothetical protein
MAKIRYKADAGGCLERTALRSRDHEFVSLPAQFIIYTGKHLQSGLRPLLLHAGAGMTRLDPKAAAERLRPLLITEPAPVHTEAYITEVCEHLGLEPTPLNLSHVTRLLVLADIGEHRASQYPKALNVRNEYGKMVPALYPHGHPKSGTPVVFEDEAAEAAYHAGASASG